MPTEIPLRCRCGAVKGAVGDISRTTSRLITCYCADCQAFARFLGQEGVTNERGGSTGFCVAPAELRFLEGADQLACVRLASKGLFRWYTKCCRTPVGNTAGSRALPMVMVPTVFVDRTQAGPTPESILSQAAGIKGSSAVGGTPPGVHPGLPFGPIAGILARILLVRLRGKAEPSPFKSAAIAQARASVQVLTPAERAALG